MMESEIIVPEPDPQGDWTEVVGLLRVPGEAETRVSFRVEGAGEVDRRHAAEAALLIFLLPVLRRGYPLRCEVPIEASFRYQLEQLAAFWTRMVPEKFAPVALRLRDGGGCGGQRPEAALTCFSGGVDSCYSAVTLTHQPSGGVGSYPPLQGALMIHGLDIPKDDKAAFDRALQRSERITQARGLTLHRAWTDARGLERRFGLSWGPEFHGFALGAVLRLYAGRYGVGVIPSTYAYDRLSLPWGSNPISDPMMGSNEMPVLHHGAQADKFDKVAAISPVDVVAENLRVCWEGKDKSGNCGRCYKCMATHLAFTISGRAEPACFPAPLDFEHLARLPVKNRQNRGFFVKLERLAGEMGQTELQGALQRCLHANASPEEYFAQSRRKGRLRKKIRRLWQRKKT